MVLSLIHEGDYGKLLVYNFSRWMDGYCSIKSNYRNAEFRFRLEMVLSENWVLVDLLDVYQQIGVNVFDRIKEFNKARNIGDINISRGLGSIK